MNKKFLLYSLLYSLMFNGCSYFEFNWVTCDKMNVGADGVMPQECRNYNEEEAKKSFDNTKNNVSKSEDERILEYHKEDEDK